MNSHSVNASVRDFAAAWDTACRPIVLDYLESRSGSARAELAADLIRIDLQHRLRLGEEVHIDEYLHDIPELRDAEVELVALLIDEHALRTEAGQVVTLEEYARRFPEHVDTLRNELGLTDDRMRSPQALGITSSETGGHSADGEQQLEPGKVIGDFRIQKLLGAGGVSRVFLATQLSLDRQVALKVTVESDEDTSGGNEGRTMAAFSHPHIVPVFAEERVGRQRLLAMEYVDGPTLSEFLDSARSRFHGSGNRKVATQSEALSLIGELCLEPQSDRNTQRRDVSCRDFLCKIIRDLARALAAANARGVIHSDVKPANILLTRDGKAMLADFNVSFRQDSVSAEPPPVGGTLLYMSPEQLGILTGSESQARLDERSDIYSLGLVLFEVLTGGWPFLEGNVSTDPVIASGQLQANRLSSPIEFPAGSRWLTPGLKSIIEKCLSPQPEDRYRSADELADDLDHFLTHRPLKTALETSRLERTLKWIKRSPARAILAATVVGTASLLVFMFRLNDRSQDSPASYGTEMPRVAVTTLTPGAAKRSREADIVGQQLLAEGNFVKAAQHFELATGLNPQAATTWHNLGVARFRLGQFADSLSAFDRSIALGNESGLAYSHRAAARFALGDEAGAQADCDTAIEFASPQEKDEVLLNQQEFDNRRTPVASPVRQVTQ
ncbi:MAG: serine/threonine-protein kinase [Planctomycetota bacterium]|nr:serine/threonine-protein kinase [Planctomycetota bacterium]